MALTAEQRRRIRQELQRRAQKKIAWKAGGGTQNLSASMKGWAGFGGAGSATHLAQLEYIKKINKNQKFKETKKKQTKKAAIKARAPGSKVKTHIATKGAGSPAPTPKITTTKKAPKTNIKGNLTDAQKWYRAQKKKYGGDKVKMQKVRAMHKRKFPKK